jgi:hypothetical protein
MEEQFSHHCEPDESLNDQAGAEGAPPDLCADRRQNVHPIKRELFERFENEINKKNRVLPVNTAPPEEYGEQGLQHMGREPEIIPQQ